MVPGSPFIAGGTGRGSGSDLRFARLLSSVNRVIGSPRLDGKKFAQKTQNKLGGNA